MNHASIAFDDLAHALRVLMEAHWRAYDGLFQTDSAEAVGNIEAGLASVLNGFHSLCDALNKDLPQPRIDGYGSCELATILALRNARHHNLVRKVRTLYASHLYTSDEPNRPTRYVLIDFPAGDMGATFFHVYLSWADFDELLGMPKSRSKLRPDICTSIRAYLGSEKFPGYAENFRQPISKVFFNAVPLIVNAGAKIFPHLNRTVTPRSMESEVYLELFSSIKPADIKDADVKCRPFAFPPLTSH